MKSSRQEHPLDFWPFLKVLKNSWILACGPRSAWETSEVFFFLGWSLFPRKNIKLCKKNFTFPSSIFWRSFVERKTKEPLLLFCWTVNRQTVYSVWSQNQIPRNLSCLLNQRKIAYSTVIWEQIVYIGYCDVKHNMWCIRALRLVGGLDKPVRHQHIVKKQNVFWNVKGI